ncbi:hypothetical protein EI050_23550 [Escherichia coli]|nr:hypothetical protein [Escherichia coli]
MAKPPGAAASGGYKRQHFANPALDLNRSKISYVRNSGYQAAPDEMFLVPAVATKHFLSPSIHSRNIRGEEGVSLEIGIFCTLSALFNQSWFVRG